MRLISQSGRIDISYDHCSLVIRNDFTINAILMQDVADFVMGKYRNENEALEVLERVRKNANNGQAYFQFPR